MIVAFLPSSSTRFPLEMNVATRFRHRTAMNSFAVNKFTVAKVAAQAPLSFQISRIVIVLSYYWRLGGEGLEVRISIPTAYNGCVRK